MSASLGKIFAELSIISTIKGDISKARMDLDRGLSGMGATSTAALGGIATGVGLVGAAVAGAAAIVGVQAVGAFTTFEQSVTNAASVLGLSGAAFEAARANIAAVSQELGQKTSFSSSQAADAFYNLASAGYDVANMTASDLAPMLNLAAGTQYDLASTTATTAATLSQFGLGFDSAGRIADVFSQAIGSTQANMEKLSVSMNYIGPKAASVGMSLEQTTALLGVLYNQGLNGEMAGSALRGAFDSLLNPTGAAAEVLGQMGLTLAQVNPETTDFTQIVQTLADKGLTMTQAVKIFGTEGANAMMMLTQKSGDVQKLTTDLENCGGAAERMAGQQLDTLKGSLDNLQGSIENVLINIGGALAPLIRDLAGGLAAAAPGIQTAVLGIVDIFTGIISGLTPGFESLKSAGGNLKTIFDNLFGSIGVDKAGVIDAVTGALNFLAAGIEKVTKFAADHPKLTKYVVAIVAIGAALAVLPAIVAGVAAVAAAVGGAILAVGGAIVAGLGLVLSPIGLIIAAVLLLAVAWKKNWFNIRGVTATVVGIIKAKIESWVLGIRYNLQEMGEAWDTFKDNLQAAWDNLISTLDTARENFVDGVQAIAKGTNEKLKEIIQAVKDKVRDWKARWAEFKTEAETAARAVVDAIQQFISDVKQKFTDVVNAVQDLINNWRTRFQELLTTAQTAAQNIVTAIQTFVTNIRTWFTNIITEVVTLINNWRTRWQEYLTATQTAAQNVITAITTFVTNLRTWFTNIITEVVTLITNWRTRLAEFLTAAQTAFNNVVTAIQTFVADAKTQFNDAVQAIIDLATDWYNSWETVKTDIGNAKTAIVQKLKDLVTDAKTEMANLVTEIKNGVGDIVTKVKEKATDFYNAGVAIIKELYNGIKDEFKKVLKLAEDKLADLKALMPNSPAKAGPFKVLPNWDMVFKIPMLEAIKKLGTVKSKLAAKLAEFKKMIQEALSGNEIKLTGEVESSSSSESSSSESSSTEKKEPEYSGPGYGRNIPTWLYGGLTDAVKNRLAEQASGRGYGGLAGLQGSDIRTFQAIQGQTAEIKNLVEQIKKWISSGSSGSKIEISNVKLDNSYNFDKLVGDIEKFQSARRRQRGVFT